MEPSLLLTPLLVAKRKIEMEPNRINQRWFVKLGNKLELFHVKIIEETEKTILLYRAFPNAPSKTVLGRFQKEDIAFVERAK